MSIIEQKIKHTYDLIRWYWSGAEKASEGVMQQLTNHYSYDSVKILQGDDKDDQVVVFMIDGRAVHGGLTDRMKGILTTYKWAKEHKCRFKILWTYPDKLENYLLTNEIDWRISANDISFNIDEARPIYIYDYAQPFQGLLFTHLMNKFVDGKHKQYHVYSNIDGVGKEFRYLFDELFVPGKEIQEEVNKNVSCLNNDYSSFTFRFQELLGDFKEPTGKWLTLDDEGKRRLIKKNIDTVREVYTQKEMKGKVLITSDSSLFLKEISKALDFVHIIPGSISHMDKVSDESDYKTQMRTFVEFFLIAKARTSYLICCDQMYKGCFAKYASYLGEHSFEVIRK